jgi:hypothetical protein
MSHTILYYKQRFFIYYEMPNCIEIKNNLKLTSICILYFRYNPFQEESNDKDICIFNGFLRDEPDVYVTMSGGCPFSNSFEVLFLNNSLFLKLSSYYLLL